MKVGELWCVPSSLELTENVVGWFTVCVARSLLLGLSDKLTCTL